MKTSRRNFLARLAAGATLTAVPFSIKRALAQDPGPAIRDLYDRSVVIDATGSPEDFMGGWPRAHSLLTEEELTEIAESGVTAVDVTISDPDLMHTIRNIAGWHGAVANQPGKLLLVRKVTDIDEAKRSGRLGVILGFQHTEMMGRDLEWLNRFNDLGVRTIQLTYNKRSLMGDGCLEPADAGLSKLGFEAVEQLNTLGIAVDLSHCGQRTTSEGIEASSKPPLITHSGCRALHDNPRNKDDETLRAMAAKGGVIGIYFMPFLGDNGTPWATRAMVLDHIDHALKICGEDHVGIGTDGPVPTVRESKEFFDMMKKVEKQRAEAGIQAPGEQGKFPYIQELNHPRRIEEVAQGMHLRGHAESVIEKVIGGNFHRVFGEIWV
ncbi:MAG: peptidase M19, renal dipeptidase [Gammaproteobacteria bacterium]|jgi:membrane dipeptidase|nr:peptidase M19, renal dipeptidase [Gammaproteobacteria bacterium]